MSYNDYDPATDDSAAVPDAAIEEPGRIEWERRIILDAKRRGPLAKLGAYTRLSGPGWLQGAITLGGGSLTGSLFLGVLAGFSLLWLQPLAMILGVVMLSAIGYVTLSTGERPFRAINRHVNPVLGWGWAIATLMANLVWCMPQFVLGTEAVRQNLLPDVFGPQAMPEETASKAIVVALLFLVSAVIVLQYDRGGWGLKLFEIILKLMVAVVVVSFVGVVVKMATGSEALDFAQVLKGFVPNLELLFKPAPELAAAVEATGESSGFWEARVVAMQRDVMITAAATAVGINMTFLLPYSMLARGWDKDFRGLAVFDLSTGLFVPFVLATSCVVIASASQFHGKAETIVLTDIDAAPANLAGGYRKLMTERLKHELGDEEFGQLATAQAEHERRRAAPAGDRGSLPPSTPGPLEMARDELMDSLDPAERKLAAMLVERDAFQLAGSLERLTGRGVSQYVFGIGVLGMAISTIIILMLINGFVVCEMLGVKAEGAPHRIGALLAACSGAAGPFIWGGGKSQFWLAVPTSVFGMVLLPIAYVTFLLMMNSRSLMGANMPTGAKRIRWNVLMGLALLLASVGSLYSIWSKAGWYGIAGLGAFILLAVVVHFARRRS
ncbi:MAG: divalent metal cation transporter [Planctomycetes bacterium]|nr:divalent metal cation transporter [Planctomycetota bacterium]